MAGMIPPAVITIIGDDRDFITTVTRDKGLLADLAKASATPRIGADSNEFLTKLGAVKSQLADVAKAAANPKIGAETATFMSKLAAVKSTLDALSSKDVVVDANISQAMIKLAALQAALDNLHGDVAISTAFGPTVGGSTDSGVGKAIAASLGADITKAFSVGLAKAMTFGIAGGAAKGAGAAALALEVAGISATHMTVLGLDLAGSATTALAGGLLKGLAGGAVAAVGIGTDLAGIGQAANDIKLMYGDTNNLSKAIAVYGKNSIQAKDAQAQLNYDLQSFAAIARGPVMNAVKALGNFKAAFDQATGPAEAKGANIITEAIKAASAFIPIIGKFASINMTKIDQGLQPLFKFLDNPGPKGGLGIFTELEKTFTAHLPTGMNAMVQGIESLFKVIGMVAPKTGGFLTSLSNFFTKLNRELNNPKSKDSKAIDSMLTSWNTWFAFIKQASTDIYRLFSNGKDQKTGQSVIAQITGYLKELGNWENSAGGSKDLTSFFKASKGEIQAIIAIIPPIAQAIGSLVLAFAPAAHIGATVVAKGLTDVINAITAAIKELSKIPGAKGLGTGLKDVIGGLAGAAGAAAAIGLIATKMPGFTKAVDALMKVLSGTALAKIPGIGGVLSKYGSGGGNGAAALNGAATNLNEAAIALKGAAGDLAKGGIGGKGGVGNLAGDAGTIEKDTSTLSKALSALSTVTKVAGPGAILAYGFSTSHPTQANTPSAEQFARADILKGQKSKLSSAQIIKELEGQGFSTAQIKQAYQSLGQSIPASLAAGIKKGAPVANKAMTTFTSDLNKDLHKGTGVKSPSTITAAVGKDYVLGLQVGITKQGPQALKTVTGLGSGMAAALNTGSMEQRFRTAGYDLGLALSRGFASAGPQIIAGLSGLIQKQVDAAVQQALGSGLSSQKVKAGSVYK